MDTKEVSIRFQFRPVPRKAPKRANGCAKLKNDPLRHTTGQHIRTPNQEHQPAQAIRPRDGRFRAACGTGLLIFSLLATGCSATEEPAPVDSTMPPSSSGAAPTSTVTSAPLETAKSVSQLPVYWLGHSGSDVFLYREFLPGTGTEDPIQAALLAMTSQRPLDGDYFSPWRKPSKLGASISAQNVITVDISADAFSGNVDEGIAQRAIQQLVYTATAAAASAALIEANQSIQVVLLVDGHTDYRAFGQVLLDKPLVREPSYIAPIWIIDPQEGSTSTGPLEVHGRAVSPDGKLRWQLLKPGPSNSLDVYLSGTTPIAAGANQLGDFAFMVGAPAGDYELRLFYADAEDPQAQPGLETKQVHFK
jgi:spore germination protein GerM